MPGSRLVWRWAAAGRPGRFGSVTRSGAARGVDTRGACAASTSGVGRVRHCAEGVGRGRAGPRGVGYIEGRAVIYRFPRAYDPTLYSIRPPGCCAAITTRPLGFSRPVDASWLHGVREPVEVVCHGGMGPYNCIYRGDAIIGFIDFDSAGHGPRLWDLAEAADRFVPLADPTANPDTISTDQPRRLRRFVDHCGRDLCAGILDAVAERERWQSTTSSPEPGRRSGPTAMPRRRTRRYPRDQPRTHPPIPRDSTQR